ncbi:hypothetical protein PTQ19_07130 [Microbacterium esteraromaticum]|uniref:hypothetical protein n=1 Tax=Microbacterium esteraromaticum TaxID=57043 RepID=UPI0023684556|nr:hypothetical protein [Microbacterium esteraromaticum]WDH80196.1 hypothetical protein PTQ19_07130 [Microbacterium esteraromaticum]
MTAEQTAEQKAAAAKAAEEQAAAEQAKKDAEAKAAAEAKAKAAQKPAAKPNGLKVVGAAVVLRADDGSERYLYRGATVDAAAFSKDSIKHAIAVGLIAKA